MGTNFDITPFVALGRRITRSLQDESLDEVIARSVTANGWFTPDSVRTALGAIAADLLTEAALVPWLDAYRTRPRPKPREVTVVMAGNLPLVGFADLLYVLLAGHRARIKPSSKDRVLMEWVADTLLAIDPSLPIELTEDPDQRPPEALIATGSNATRLYFRERYSGIPTLLRGSRHSAAVLDGNETADQLASLGEDIFTYFGLGCRSVSHLLLPRAYPLQRLTGAFASRRTDHTPYRGGYLQGKALCRMTGRPYTGGGFYLLCEGELDGRPPAMIGYTYYGRPEEARAWIEAHDERLQCVVSGCFAHPRRMDFGQAQHPRPQDYPDGADVMDFLLNL